jgi:SSS family solute:Na+ symporter
MVISIGHNFAYRFDWLHYGSQMGANFYGAIYGWSVCFVVTAAMSAFTRGKPVEELEGITFSVTGKMWREISPLTIAWGVGLLVVCVVLNVLFR